MFFRFICAAAWRSGIYAGKFVSAINVIYKIKNYLSRNIFINRISGKIEKIKSKIQMTNKAQNPPALRDKIRNSAFTLAETILAIAIIALVITTTYGLSQNSLKIGRNSINQFIAYHLAEEGLEIVRNARDSNWLQNKEWRTGLQDGEFENSKIVLSEGEKFKRIIKLRSLDEVMRVESVVYYQYGNKEKEISLIVDLTDWKKGPL